MVAVVYWLIYTRPKEVGEERAASRVLGFPQRFTGEARR